MTKLSEAVREKVAKINIEMLDTLEMTSIQYAVMYKGEIVLSGASGVYDKKESKPLDQNIMYGIGSISKVYTTAAVMLLVDQGKLDIDQSFQFYVPDFEMADKRYVDITPRHLMNHSSGIYGSHFRGAFLYEDNDTYVRDQLLANLKDATLKYAPGTFSAYCNDGFQLLELLIERVSGMKYGDYLKTFFFEPLGLNNTKTPLDDFDNARLARAYTSVADGALPVLSTNAIGTGGLVATAEDVCRFGQVLTGKKILSQAAAKAMSAKEYEKGLFWVQDEDRTGSLAYGLGWDNVHLPPFDQLGIRAVAKGGDTSHYHAILICLPDHDMMAAVLSSGGYGFTNRLLAATLLQEALREYGIIEETAPPMTFTEPIKTAMPSALLKYNGIYAEYGAFINIEIEDGEFELPALLKGLIPSDKYVYTGEGMFTNSDGTVTMQFLEQPGDLIFVQANIALVFPFGNVISKSFIYQKLATCPLELKTAAVWEKRAGKRFFPVNDKYTSDNFLTMMNPVIKNGLSVNTELGYAFGGCQITDENTAQNILYARDVSDLLFEIKNGVEYLRIKDEIYINEDYIPDLDAKQTTVTIAADGYTKHFWVKGAAGGKTMTVQLPRNSAFAVYSNELEYKCFSTITKLNTAELAEGDLIAFVGAAGDVFTISLV